MTNQRALQIPSHLKKQVKYTVVDWVMIIIIVPSNISGVRTMINVVCNGHNDGKYNRNEKKTSN